MCEKIDFPSLHFYVNNSLQKLVKLFTRKYKAISTCLAFF